MNLINIFFKVLNSIHINSNQIYYLLKDNFDFKFHQFNNYIILDIDADLDFHIIKYCSIPKIIIYLNINFINLNFLIFIHLFTIINFMLNIGYLNFINMDLLLDNYYNFSIMILNSFCKVFIIHNFNYIPFNLLFILVF